MDGHCAYDDGECSSGKRWSNNAPEAGQCVDEPGTSGTTNAVASATMSGSASATGSTGSAGSTGELQCGWRQLIEIDTASFAGTSVLDGYPLVIEQEHADLVGHDAPSFTDAQGNALPFEIESFDSAAGTVRAWVRLPSWSPTEALEIYLWFGDPTQGADNDPTEVWNPAFVGVWHLDDELTGSENDIVFDSTAADERGHPQGGMNADQVTPAVVGPGFTFEGDDDAVDFEASFAGALESFTISAWVRVDGDDAVEAPFFEKVNGDNLYPRCRKRPEPDGGVQCQLANDGGVHLLRGDPSLLPRGEFRHVALAWDAETGLFELYLEGVLAESMTYEPGPSRPGDFLPQIGRIDEFGSLTGTIDEFRVADRVLDAAWVAADAKTQREPSSVIASVGPTEPAPCP